MRGVLFMLVGAAATDAAVVVLLPLTCVAVCLMQFDLVVGRALLVLSGLPAWEMSAVYVALFSLAKRSCFPLQRFHVLRCKNTLVQMQLA